MKKNPSGWVSIVAVSESRFYTPARAKRSVLNAARLLRSAREQAMREQDMNQLWQQCHTTVALLLNNARS